MNAAGSLRFRLGIAAGVVLLAAVLAVVVPAPGHPAPSRVNRPSSNPCGAPWQILYISDEGYALVNSLRAMPDVQRVDIYSGTVPTLTELSQYDIVFVSLASGSYDGSALGNVLADYEDAHGIVVAVDNDWRTGAGLAGRWLADGYSPYNDTTIYTSTGMTLGNHDASHPLMQGVSTLGQSRIPSSVSLGAGATEVAEWSNGVPAVAVKGRAVGINQYLGNLSSDDPPLSGDYPQLVVNAGKWLCASPPPPPACVVPNVVGKALAAAKRAIATAHCQTGKVTRAYSRKFKARRVIAEKPRPGTKLAHGGKVSLVVSRGRRHR